jgi:hypothetical protein
VGETIKLKGSKIDESKIVTLDAHDDDFDNLVFEEKEQATAIEKTTMELDEA